MFKHFSQNHFRAMLCAVWTWESNVLQKWYDAVGPTNQYFRNNGLSWISVRFWQAPNFSWIAFDKAFLGRRENATDHWVPTVANKNLCGKQTTNSIDFCTCKIQIFLRLRTGECIRVNLWNPQLLAPLGFGIVLHLVLDEIIPIAVA